MTLRIQNRLPNSVVAPLVAAMLALTILFVGLGGISQNSASGGYQLFSKVEFGSSAHNPLNAQTNYSASPKTAPEYVNVPNRTPERIVIRTNTAGDSVVSIQGREMSIHASGQATTRGISNDSIANAMDQQPFQYIQNGRTQNGYYDASTNTFVGVGDRITTVIRPRNSENYLNNLRNRQ